MHTLDLYARLVRASGESFPLDYLRGKSVQRIMQLSRSFTFAVSRDTFSCALDPAFGKAMFLSEQSRACPEQIADAMTIGMRNVVYIAENTTVMLERSSIARHMLLDIETENPSTASMHSVSVMGPMEFEEITRYLSPLEVIASQVAPVFSVFDEDGWCEVYRVPFRCLRLDWIGCAVFLLLIALGIAYVRRLNEAHESAIVDKKRTKKKRGARVDWRSKYVDASKKFETERVEMRNNVQRLSAILHHVVVFVDGTKSDALWQTGSNKGWVDVDRMLQTPMLRALDATRDDVIEVSRGDKRLVVDVSHGARIRRRKPYAQ